MINGGSNLYCGFFLHGCYCDDVGLSWLYKVYYYSLAVLSGEEATKVNASSCISFCFIYLPFTAFKIVLASPAVARRVLHFHSLSFHAPLSLCLLSVCPLYAARRTPILFYTTYMPAKLIYVILYLVQVPLILHISSTEVIYYTTCLPPIKPA